MNISTSEGEGGENISTPPSKKYKAQDNRDYVFEKATLNEVRAGTAVGVPSAHTTTQVTYFLSQLPHVN